MKYVDTLVGFNEVPNEISLCINLSQCPNNCHNCHSSYLAEDIGTPLTEDGLDRLVTNGISCVCLMGGDMFPEEINNLARHIKYDLKLKVCWYSGKEELSDKINLDNFDYYKLGPYKEELGPLNSKTTNQKFFTREGDIFIDKTYLFWNDRNL